MASAAAEAGAGSPAKQGGWDNSRSAAGKYNPWLIVAIISLPTFMEVLDTSIANVSLDHIAGGLSISTDQATWVLTSYLVANAIVIPISGWLSDAIGRKRYFLISIGLFTISSLICGLSPNLSTLVIARSRFRTRCLTWPATGLVAAAGAGAGRDESKSWGSCVITGRSCNDQLGRNFARVSGRNQWEGVSCRASK